MVMDSRNDDVVKNFSRMIHHQTSCTLMYPEKKMSFVMDKPYNVIDSVVYVDSEYSEIIQLADSVSYLLSKLDYKKQGKTLTQFGQRLTEITERLDPSLVMNSIVTMNLG